MMKSTFDNGRTKHVSTAFRLTVALAITAASSSYSPLQAQDAAPKGADSPSPANAEAAPVEIAKLPYQQLVTIARNNAADAGAEPGADNGDTADADAEKKTEKMMLRISSTKGVPVDKITLTIMRATGPVDIAIDEKGDFEVPWSQELYDENPMVVSNQPKGTMNLGFTIVIPEMRPKVVDGKVAYRDLFKQLLEAQKAMRKTNPDFGKPGFDTFAIQIVGGGDEVAVVRSLGSRTVKPDAEGDVWLVYDLLLYDENPSVTLPEKAQVNIVPVDARDSIRIRAQ